MARIIPVLKRKFFWKFPVPATDDFGAPIIDEFVIGVVKVASRSAMHERPWIDINGNERGTYQPGPWGFMTPESWREHGVGWMGEERDYGKRYQKTHNGWLLIDEPVGGPTAETRQHDRWYKAEERRGEKRAKYFIKHGVWK